MKNFFLVICTLVILNIFYTGYMINCIRIIRKARTRYGVYEIKNIPIRSFYKWWGKNPRMPFNGAIESYLMDRQIHIVYSIYIFLGLIACTILVTGINHLME